MGDDGSIPLQFLVIVLFIFLNAFFSIGETALVSGSNSRIKKLAEDSHSKNKILSAIQIGITFSGLLVSAIASDSFSERLSDHIIKQFSIDAPGTHIIKAISMLLITLLLSYVILVFGVLIPKHIAIKKGDQIARHSMWALKATAIIFAPFVKILTHSVNGILRLLRMNTKAEEEEVTEEEIRLMVSEGQEQGVIDDAESEMINNILEFDEMTAADVMTHRTNLTALPCTATYQEVFDTACHERYSRIPIYDDSIDNIIGIIHIKDLLGMRDEESFDLSRIIRPVTYVAGTQNIDEVFRVLKEASTHLAVVVDEYGGTEGIITMEDILEELVGNIRDEYDEEEEFEHPIVKVREGEYIISGLAELDEVAEELNADLPVDEYDTASGFAIGILGEIPDEGTTPEFSYQGYTFKVLSSNEKIINSLKAVKIKETTNLSPSEAEEA